jgi:ABC-type transport system substrate-binding protein
MIGFIPASRLCSPFYLSPEKGLKTYAYNPDKAKELLKKAEGFVYTIKMNCWMRLEIG